MKTIHFLSGTIAITVLIWSLHISYNIGARNFTRKFWVLNKVFRAVVIAMSFHEIPISHIEIGDVIYAPNIAQIVRRSFWSSNLYLKHLTSKLFIKLITCKCALLENNIYFHLSAVNEFVLDSNWSCCKWGLIGPP